LRRRWWLLAAYLLLLLASHAVRSRAARDRRAPEPSFTARAVGAVEGEATTTVAYRRWGADATDGRPALLLLHGSPGSSRDFDSLAPLLAERFQMVAPDLPGFGQSRSPVPDYSIRAHADYTEQLLNGLAIERAHVVGFSMGGGVALELAARAPLRIASITLLSSIGVQEFELLGNYQINHAIHGAQLAGLTAILEGTPHFGRFDGGMLTREYARNFYDTDQRPLRGVLEALEVPTLILHGESDPLVPAAAAREHHRLVPQSELVMLDSDHFMVFREPAVIAEPLLEFLDRVESGQATTRAEAASERLRSAAEPLDPDDLPRAVGLTRLVWIALLALATLISEDLTGISAGLLAAQGRIDLGTAIFACALGIFLGDLALFWIGRVFGRPWLRRIPLRWLVSEEAIEVASEWFRRRGPIVILISRFTPGMRLSTYITAGVLDTSLSRFIFFFAISVLLWTPLLVGVSAWVGAPAVEWLSEMPVAATLALPAFAILLWLLFGVARGLLTWRGRRLWAGRLCRLRHSNPAIPDGGFVGESKRHILDLLPGASVASYAPLPGGVEPAARQALAEGLVERHGLDLPVVLKPDVGERGREVCIARSWSEVSDYLTNTSEDALAQEFVAGPELGVFYVRLPDEESGRIFSITEKRLIEVVGDGESSLEHLILSDRRAVCMAPLFLRRHRARLREIPGRGERVRLVDVGTHCRGALFLDGNRFHSPELETAIDQLSRQVPGFFFGRYDLRAHSEEAFREGRDFKVLELNGVTSEATHIYDPSLGLLNAYRVLFEQWRLAFEIGAQNRRLGVSPTPLTALIGVLRNWIFRS
jgi:pimeloyl-ACP methyl ester carboxylesterase/membrane protein DedA with SNARE-associated domain